MVAMISRGDWTARTAREAFAGAPMATLEQLCAPGRVLVIAPHPDDETLGCGGVIALGAEAGLEIVVAVLTDGAASHPHSKLFPPRRLADVRRDELRDALAVLSGGRVQSVQFDAPDGRLKDREDEAVPWLARLGPFGTVFATWAADPHPDHQAAYRIAATITDRWDARLYAYPIWGLTLDDGLDAGPAGAPLRLDIRDVVEKKRRAVAAYRSQSGGLIDDDPRGFRLTEADIERHLGDFETYIVFGEQPLIR